METSKTKQLKRLAVLFAVLSEAREQLETSGENPTVLLDIDDLQDKHYPAALHGLVEDATDIVLSLLETLPEGVLKDDINNLLRVLKDQAVGSY